MPRADIESSSNPAVRQAAALLSAKGRAESGLFLLEGSKLIAEALHCGVVFEALYCLPDHLPRLQDMPISPVTVSEQALRKMSDLTSPPGVVAVARQRTLCSVSLQSGGAYLVAENIQDAGNLGNMMRTAEAFGVQGVLLTGSRVDIYSPKVLRGSMGSSLRIPTQAFDSPQELKDELERVGLSLWGAALARGGERLGRCDASCNAIAIGNESAGLSAELLAVCDAIITIPMTGGVESLSAPSATAVLLWELFWKHRLT